MIEAIIGRKHGTNSLLMTIQGKSHVISSDGTVPNTVSSSHCKLVVDNDGTWTLSNIKSELDTFVDGLQIDHCRVTPQSHVELGANHFCLDMQKVGEILGKIAPKVVSLRPLEQIWKEYDEEKFRMQNREMKIASFQRLQGILTMSAMLLAFIPQLGVFRWIILGLALLIAVYFFIRGMQTSKSLTIKLRKLNEVFEKKYVCPNPECTRFMGYIPYNQLQYSKGCPACQCQYKNT